VAILISSPSIEASFATRSRGTLMMVRAIHGSQPEYPATFGGNPKTRTRAGTARMGFRSM
jgi:hypothetical protein